MAGKTSDASSSTIGATERGESVVYDCRKRKSSCGYCKSSSRGSITHGLWASNNLTVDDYQGLLDRGWRRSGCYIYKPEMERTCCPSYTIRLKATDFVPSKDQLRVTRRFQRFLDGALEHDKPVEHTEVSSTSKGGSYALNGESHSVGKNSMSFKNKENEEDRFMLHLSDKVDVAIRLYTKSSDLPHNIQFPRASVKRVSHAKKKVLVQGSADLVYSCNVAFQLSACIRRAQVGEMKNDNLSSSESNTAETGFIPKIIAEKLVNHLSQVDELSGFSIKAFNGHINFYSDKGEASFPKSGEKATISQETAKARSKDSSTDKNPKCSSPKRQKFEIRMKRSSFDPVEYALYRRYQLLVHNDTPDRITEASYRSFLVDTPLNFVPSTGDGTVPPCGFGSFHQQYLIDGKLVAVGVVDILPRCLSSKYLFWDPDYAFLSLGKYSALQEIDWVKQNQTHCASLQYYYLGYYIHNCGKMRYKATYRPSELLCPLRYTWVPFDAVKPLLDQKSYVVLSDFSLQLNGESSPLLKVSNDMELEHNADFLEEPNDVNMDEDGEMAEVYSDSSDEDLGSESSSLASSEMEDGDVSNILIGIGDSRMRYKDIQQAISPSGRSYLENQLVKYKRVVGKELSERIVYILR
ncbi:arginyl-tRNA--protein transferase 2-like [Benincasa hispida]|uniref:arginyl-tRNA--protein transferase 2-like n=1 Tax=Benincasa hispida TaxID=102211 RepID=UPI001902925F|nr:arginyl-tRNA--protein transferase 2-like [Benincasa hispida]XP_038886339.1 arginyl-tRNA--protein transferase 2-like [Benincasa hispida]XP_038886340.1 arginyl-tRNA--protein transferase 2-like [Benincasa hispida]